MSQLELGLPVYQLPADELNPLQRLDHALASPVPDAVISPCGTYRYLLTRPVSSAGGVLGFVMLNPSTADALKDDNTIRKCMGFARQFGYGRLAVVNLFALRSTDPALLKQFQGDIIGPKNNAYIEALAARADRLIGAWGNHGKLFKRDQAVRQLLQQRQIYALGELSRDGQPKHSLYQPYDSELIEMKI